MNEETRVRLDGELVRGGRNNGIVSELGRRVPRPEMPSIKLRGSMHKEYLPETVEVDDEENNEIETDLD